MNQRPDPNDTLKQIRVMVQRYGDASNIRDAQKRIRERDRIASNLVPRIVYLDKYLTAGNPPPNDWKS